MRVLRWLKGLFNYAEFVISLSFFVVVTSVVLWLAWPDWVGNSDFPGDVLVEAHGLVFDLAALGVLFSIFRYIALQREEKRRAEEQRQARIARYNEEIDDFRHWKSEEAAFRIAGNIRRLHREGVVPEDLMGVYLKSTVLRWADLSEAVLVGANLSRANLTMAKLGGARMWEADLRGTTLWGTDLSGADLWRANLDGASLLGSSLLGASLRDTSLRGTIYNSQPIRNKSVGDMPSTNWPEGFTPPPEAIDVSQPDYELLVLLQEPVPAVFRRTDIQFMKLISRMQDRREPGGHAPTPPAAPPPAPTSD